MFATFAEHYQIWDARAYPLVGAAARRGGSEGRKDDGVEKQREEEERKEGSLKAKCLKCNRIFKKYFIRELERMSAQEINMTSLYIYQLFYTLTITLK